MKIYKNISRQVIKIHNHILYPSQTIKLKESEFVQYKDVLQEVIKKQVEGVKSSTVIKPTLNATNNTKNNSNPSPVINVNIEDIVQALHDISNALKDFKDNLGNVTFTQNVLNNHKKDTPPPKVNIPAPVQKMDTQSENDLLSNLLENSIR